MAVIETLFIRYMHENDIHATTCLLLSQMYLLFIYSGQSEEMHLLLLRYKSVQTKAIILLTALHYHLNRIFCENDLLFWVTKSFQSNKKQAARRVEKETIEKQPFPVAPSKTFARVRVRRAKWKL